LTSGPFLWSSLK